MLKIKNEVDLKELEKFGFKYKKLPFENSYCRKYITNNNVKSEIVVGEKGREIKDCYDSIYWVLYDTFKDKYIDDLIKADLVEKVEE